MKKQWTRAEDVAVEQAACERLEQRFRAKGIRFEKVTDRERQFRGVDYAIWTKDGRAVNVDVKAKFHDLQDGRQFPSAFSFEIDRTCRDGERRVGWFADPRSLTELYIYQYPKFVNGEDLEDGIKPDMVCQMFAKSEIVKLVGGKQALPYLVQESYEMYVRGESRKQKDGFALYLTPKYRCGGTEPVNVLIAPEEVKATAGYREFYC